MKTLLRSLFFLLCCGVAARAGEVKIVAAENFYGGVAALIAGGNADVTSILSNPNQDPHEFTTNASTAKALADADVVIYNGIDYDPWMEKLLASGGKPDRTVICVAHLIGAKAGDNPHIWYDPKTMPALADKLEAILRNRISMKRDLIQINADNFRKSMKPLLENIASLRATYSGFQVTATEPVFGYMSDALGLKMTNEDFQVKVMNDTEPSADETAAFEKCLKAHTVKVLFYNSQVTDPTTDRMKEIATKSGVPIVGVTETQPAGKSYVEWMLDQLDAVAKALPIEHF